MDITVPPPASSSAPNAKFLGVGNSGTAFITGDVIHRGETTLVILFGPGLSSITSLSQVKISGPADITLSAFKSIKATDGTPGVQFTAAVASNAGPGGRTVLLIDPQSDITTFTGGLEVIP